jgi:hypothetical protein
MRVRRQEGWPQSSDPTAGSIALPVLSGQPADASDDDADRRSC